MMDALIKIVTASILLAIPTGAGATDIRRCHFDLVRDVEGNTFEVAWDVIITRNGSVGEVDVINSGNYTAEFQIAEDVVDQVVFDTSSSREWITTGEGEKAYWAIDFFDGGDMAYWGRCGAFERSN